MTDAQDLRSQYRELEDSIFDKMQAGATPTEDELDQLKYLSLKLLRTTPDGQNFIDLAICLEDTNGKLNG